MLNLLDNNVIQLFKRCSTLDPNEKMSILDMLKTSTAFINKKIYTEEDLKLAADLIEKCLKWVP